jgi:hypothetical protein
MGFSFFYVLYLATCFVFFHFNLEKETEIVYILKEKYIIESNYNLNQNNLSLLI